MFAKIRVLGFSVLMLMTSVASAHVVSSFSVLDDLVRRILPVTVETRVLVPAGRDSHGHQLSAGDLKALKSARLIVRVGAGYEPWLDRALKSTGSGASVLLMTDGVVLREIDHEHTHGSHSHGHHGHAHAHGARDPHVWLNPRHVREFSVRLQTRLTELYPEQKKEIDARTTAWLAELDAAIAAWSKNLHDASVRGPLLVPHAAFGYFGEAFNVKFMSLTGVDSEVEPSARQLAKLVTEVRKGQAVALFHEGDRISPLIERLSRETGVKALGHLYADTLSVKSDGPRSYLEMMKHNVEVIARALALSPAANHPKN